MQKVFRYNKEKQSLEEQPRMERPKGYIDYSEGYPVLWSDKARAQFYQYRKHIVSLLSYPTTHRDWPNVPLIKGVHFITKKVSVECPGPKRFLAAVPLPKPEQEAPKWNDDKVIDFVNWFLKLHRIPSRYELENLHIIESFLNGDSPEDWHTESGTPEQEEDQDKPDFFDSYGDIVVDGTKIIIEAHYNYQHFINRPAIVKWNSERGMYRFYFIEKAKHDLGYDFYGVHKFKKVK